MSKQILWLVVSSLMTLSLVMAACSPAATPATPTKPTVPTAPTAPVVSTTPAAETSQKELSSQEKPKYGGTLTLLETDETGVWDNTAVGRATSRATEIVYESLVTFDWVQAREGKVDWSGGIVGTYENWGPQLAESWEAPELGTWVLKIRRGVHYQLNPSSEASRLMGGREMTADDVVWNITRLTKTPGAHTQLSNPKMSEMLQATKTGPWEVTLKMPYDPLAGWWWVIYGGNAQHIWARDVIEKYGNQQDWRRAVGTGPFMVTDYVPASATTLIRNPNYWDKDPIGPGKGNQLPYVETVRFLIIPDTSTRLAALRTGKGDWAYRVGAEEAKQEMKLDPKLKYVRFLATPNTIAMRLDNPKVPFYDKRVRMSMAMAIDNEAIARDFFRGDAITFAYPVPPVFPDVFVPLEKMPKAVQEIYTYNPEKAKQLLKEAGYPAGFKTTMIVPAVSLQVDYASILKDMWAKVGVDVEIQPREPAVHTSISRASTWENMIMGSSTAASASNWIGIFQLSPFRSQRVGAPATQQIDDQKIDDYYQEIMKHTIVNMPRARELIKEIHPYILEQVFRIPLVGTLEYTLWHPWVKNHYGEYRPKIFARYAWIDQDLKKAMRGGR